MFECIWGALTFSSTSSGSFYKKRLGATSLKFLSTFVVMWTSCAQCKKECIKVLDLISLNLRQPATCDVFDKPPSKHLLQHSTDDSSSLGHTNVIKVISHSNKNSIEYTWRLFFSISEFVLLPSRSVTKHFILLWSVNFYFDCNKTLFDGILVCSWK